MTEISPTEFRERFSDNTTWAEAERDIRRLDKETAKGLYQAMKIVRLYVGLDMRSEFYMGLIRAIHQTEK